RQDCPLGDGRSESCIMTAPALAWIDTKPFVGVLQNVGPIAGDKPQLRWIAIACLRIDRTYQREIVRRGAANIVRIAREFDWTRFGTVIVAEHEQGLYTVIDGQHRTTAAALRGIRDVPCQVVRATTAEAAAAFAAINGNITLMTAQQLHTARLAAG